MRKPLAALSLVLSTGLGVMTAADALAAPTGSSNPGTTPSAQNVPLPPANPAGTSSQSTNAVSGAAIVQTAFRYLGYPYTTTGNSPATGFSCIGFASFVYRSLGINLPGDLGGALSYAPQVPFANLQPGDLLYFQNTVWTGLSHVAIYIGGGRFVHSEWYGKGVRVSSFNNDPSDGNYWISKYLGANRPWKGAAVAPIIVPPGPPSGAVTHPTVNSVSKVITGTAAVVTVSRLNVRTAPNGAMVTTLYQGANVTIVGKRNGWYAGQRAVWFKVALPSGGIGWVISVGVGKGEATNPGTSVTSGSSLATVPAPPQIGTAPSAPVVRRHLPTTGIKVSGLRVHSGPSTNAPVVTSVSTGQRVQILARSNGWMKVRTSSGAVGWVVAGYTNATRRTAASVSATTYNAYAYHPAKHTAARRASYARTSARGPVMSAGVRVHSGPRIGAHVVGLVAAGTHVTVLGYRGSWALVRLPSGQVGYVAAGYVRR